MKVALALLVAVIGFSLVAAEDNLDEVLNLESRDTRRACLMATRNCNDRGKCVQDKREEWYCQCEQPYMVGGSESSCYLPVPEGKNDLKMAACERDTNKCDGHGKCHKSTFGRGYICLCDAGYASNSYGGCSEVDAREIESARNVELEMLTRDTLAR
ncbi:exogastrula-inducing polypeptide isoform X2 [Strongylocentrotus purpuratus]|uniref:EGF-like domain-containing protein n=1 Tax=Strongylocentrotus purpuratus TaxID=7668 RepID=A0A7M7NU03_STRPU|nr:exogastrula-inducing polypeptide isoform X2 [Strongylocentrotus purpuratus]